MLPEGIGEFCFGDFAEFFDFWHGFECGAEQMFDFPHSSGNFPPWQACKSQIPEQVRLWSIAAAGFSESVVPTTTAGTPATVVWAGTSARTTLPAPILAPLPISTRPRILAPAPIITPDRTTGCRSPEIFPVPPRVTS